MEVTLNSTKSTKSTDKNFFFCNGSLKLSEKEKAVCLIRQKSHTSCLMNAVQTPAFLVTGAQISLVSKNRY